MIKVLFHQKYHYSILSLWSWFKHILFITRHDKGWAEWKAMFSPLHSLWSCQHMEICVQSNNPPWLPCIWWMIGESVVACCGAKLSLFHACLRNMHVLCSVKMYSRFFKACRFEPYKWKEVKCLNSQGKLNELRYFGSNILYSSQDMIEDPAEWKLYV